ncbi:MFS general substrate transporter [Abortiporus biennis]|nr:MFS general substrate transporter [Abortiporus biennis]
MKAGGPSGRMRRRSELQRSRTEFAASVQGGAAATMNSETIELSPVAETPSPPLGGIRMADSYFPKDVEIAASLPVSAAPSIRYEEDTNSLANVNEDSESPTEKATRIRKSRIHFFALCFAFFLEGWNDGTTGPLLPTIQRYYGIGFAVVSIIFILNCVGFISGALSNVYLNDKFGFGKKHFHPGAIAQTCAYVLLGPGGPFPLMCIAFLFAGFGISLQNAQANGFVGSLKRNGELKMSFLHASYGFGAFLAPLVATQFANARHWSYHYFISAGLGVCNCAILFFVFRGRDQTAVLTEEGQITVESPEARENKYKKIIGIRTVHFLSLWALIYVGVEVTLGGWIVTYIEQKRGGGASAGYISSGFFAGLMLGRILFISLNRKVGERRIMFVYAFLAIQLEVTIWVVPSLVENAIAVAAIGLLLGPMYPILMNYCTSVLPKWMLTACVGWISGVGFSGSAILPFVTGILASKFGISSLQPLIVSMMSTMILIWAFIPRVRRID